MSHYTKVKTRLTNKESLLKALEDMGFVKEQVKVSDVAMRLEGYNGDLRQDTAEIILPRKHVGGASNDIGFKLQEDGTYGAIISEYDQNNSAADYKSKYAKGCHGYSATWLKRLNQRYAYHQVKEQISSQGFFIESESEENGEILLKVNAAAFVGGE